MTDPGETVDLLNLSTVGWHCGNQVGIGLEVVGYARYSFAEWTTGDQFAAVRLDAKRAAEVAAAKGIPLRWLSLGQIRNGERGFCTHADISATLGGTNHTDPGQGFPYAIFMQMVQQWTSGAAVGGTPSPNPQPAGGTGGAAPSDNEEDDDNMPLTRLIRCDNFDYATGPGVFYQIPSQGYFQQGEALGWWGAHSTAIEMNADQLKSAREQCERMGNSLPKG
jgi:hypothetical protein